MSDRRAITAQHLRVPWLDGLMEFYVGKLGMQAVRECPKELSFSFPGRGCDLVFCKADVLPHAAQSNDFYWKIGITVRDLDLAVAFLRSNDIDVSDPVQFRDIGYMSKITDPHGFIIELLQQGFEGNAKTVDAGHAIGAQATLAHITLRVTDISSAQTYFEQTLGMRLMSVQPVEEYQFCLYFYSWGHEALPNPDLEAVENREWLWARPYTFIELQHLQSEGAKVRKTSASSAGFDGFSHADASGDEAQRVSIDDLSTLM